MTLFLFYPKQPVRRTSLRTHFYKILNFLEINNKIYTESFQWMKYDGKFLNFCNWFINDKVVTFFLFYPKQPVRCTSFRSHFYKILFFLEINNKIYTESFQWMKYDGK